VIAGLPTDDRPLPTVSHYDELLTRRHQQQNEASVANTGEVS
jgi:hypothetical protein